MTTRETGEAALFSRVSRLRRSTLAHACTPFKKSEEKERLLAAWIIHARSLSFGKWMDQLTTDHRKYMYVYATGGSGVQACIKGIAQVNYSNLRKHPKISSCSRA